MMLPIVPLVETRASTPLSDRALSARSGLRSEGRGFVPIPQQINLRQHRLSWLRMLYAAS